LAAVAPADHDPDLTEQVPMLGFKPIEFVPPGTKFRFVHHWRLALAETIALALLTLYLLASPWGPGLNYGVDFRGGTKLELRLKDGQADIAAIRGRLELLNIGGLQIQQFGDRPSDVLIRMEEQPGGDKGQLEVIAKVQKAVGENVEVLAQEVIGPAVSAELISSAIWALGLSTLGIFLYIWFRFEWQFSASAIIALLHDIAMTVCVLSILRIEFDLSVVAALLTLIGYAVNDTVVTFDRVRENLRKYKRMPLGELIDLSVNETLSRTAMTAGAVLITLIALFVLGGPVIRGFALTILVGGVVSSYTSMFVAAPLLYVLGVKREWDADTPARKGAAETSRARVTFK
jgi:preprotein translocase SecF subunit